MHLGGLKKASCFPIIFCVLIVFSLSVNAAESGRLYPLTLLEMQKIFSRWLDQSGYAVYASALPEGSVQLSGIRDDEKWRIVLHAHSPLFTSFEAEYFAAGRPDSRRIRELTDFLDDYLAKNGQVSNKKPAEIPPALLRISGVACVSALSGGAPIHFSGFVAAAGGMILSTAHDLDSVKDVSVTTADGRQLSGRIIKRDMRRDLALIRVETRFSSFFNLKQARDVLKKGEPVYALSCLDGERKILPGLIAGPVKTRDNLPMWQLEMETPRGSSGSPVFDRDGRILGIIKGRYRGNQSIGFVIPAETIVNFLNED